jgi:radical SAM protein with 4Fe4S-binding SPASM domain
MPNLLLTQKCVRRCPYCFADEYMADSAGQFLRWDDYIYVVDFFERNQIDMVSMLGGEPTLHPDVIPMMEYALQRGFDIRMFTSAVVADSTREQIAGVIDRYGEERRIHFTVNMNHPEITPPAQAERQERFLRMVGRRASLGFNIYQPDFDLDFVFETISRFGLLPNLRLGLTHPIALAKEGNAHVRPEQYREVANTLARYFPKFDRNRVIPDFDCGFPACMFTDEQLGQLLRLRASFRWTCGPIVDIGPDLQLWPCFPLSHLRSSTLYDFDSMQEILESMSQDIRRRRRGNLGFWLECDDCSMLERQLCSGGCLTYSLVEDALD